jgi:hypothetical protein
MTLWRFTVNISGYPYRHQETDNGQNKHSYIIKHDMGKKWSMYLASLYQEVVHVFDELEFDKTENTLASTIDSG